MYLDEQNPISEVAQFKIYLQEILEQRINAIPDQGLDPDDERNYVNQELHTAKLITTAAPASQI